MKNQTIKIVNAHFTAGYLSLLTVLSVSAASTVFESLSENKSTGSETILYHQHVLVP